MTSSIRKINASELELTVDLSATDLKGYVSMAEESLSKTMKIDGFRAGKIPTDVIRKHISETALREEALGIAIDRSLSKAIKDENVDVLDQTDFSIKENTPDKLLYSIKLILYPSVELGEYKGMKVTKKLIEVKDEELQQTLSDIAASRATGEGEAKVIPELNDAFAQSLGQFKSLEDLKIMIKEGLTAEKTDKEKQRVRIELMNQIIAGSKMVVPETMVNKQLDSLMSGFEADLQAQGMELALYLAHIKKTQDELRKEWTSQAEQQVKMMLVLHEVAKKEKIAVGEKELQDVLEMRLQQYLAGRPDATQESIKDLDMEMVKNRLYSELLNKKVFEFIESHATLS